MIHTIQCWRCGINKLIMRITSEHWSLLILIQNYSRMSNLRVHTHLVVQLHHNINLTNSSKGSDHRPEQASVGCVPRERVLRGRCAVERWVGQDAPTTFRSSMVHTPQSQTKWLPLSLVVVQAMCVLQYRNYRSSFTKQSHLSDQPSDCGQAGDPGLDAACRWLLRVSVGCCHRQGLTSDHVKEADKNGKRRSPPRSIMATAGCNRLFAQRHKFVGDKYGLQMCDNNVEW